MEHSSQQLQMQLDKFPWQRLCTSQRPRDGVGIKFAVDNSLI